ncbi:MAG TPA: 2-C-methyl-D-erythritol 2,4-cyclodiphosphate synthase [Desulfobacterales bacterium]|nr:2-C-methyl-D-erythritol 2,4-cyclodiphosphate synthase [Desulfobacterales bacterium]
MTAREINFRIGHGYDAHCLTEGRKLIMGGVYIPWDKGLLGHSDADVVTHALCDALLGALGAGDIGRHFPDSAPEYEGIDSLRLLEMVMVKVHEAAHRLINADLTIIAQQPRLSPYISQMRRNLAAVCGVSKAEVNVKATTTEGMGFSGRLEGIACHAVTLLG